MGLSGRSDAQDPDWDAALRRAIAGDGLTSHYQPIVDLARGTVVGYEALARFPGFAVRDPARWFAAAQQRGLSAELEAAALRAAFAARAALPVNTFLTVNVGPDVLRHPEVRAVLEEQGDLGGVVVELTEHARVDSWVALEPALDALRGAGALLALDDAGAGYSGLQQLLSLRPAFVKLDRSLVAGVDRDEAKRALVAMVGTLAGRIDAWILAEGVEREAELDTLVALEVPLAQGYLLARPAPPWARLAEPVEARLRRTPRDLLAPDSVGQLVEAAVTVRDTSDALLACGRDDTDVAVVLDRFDRPVATAHPDGLVHAVGDATLKVNVHTPIALAAARAITRTSGERFRPLLCTDDTGRFLGLVRMERVVEYLAGPRPAAS